jgi:K+-sensing histidine kinase KdpD
MAPEDRREFTAMASESAQRLQDEILDIFRYIQSTSAGYGGGGTCPAGELTAICAEAAASLGVAPPAASLAPRAAARTLPMSRAVLHDMMFELLENSKKFHPRNDPEVRLAVEAAATGVRVRVSDDGARLSPVQLRRIWHPYYQGDKDSTGEVPGMGLGLSMVAVLVWEAGGHCRAHNRPDRDGLVVELTIPPIPNDERD